MEICAQAGTTQSGAVGSDRQPLNGITVLDLGQIYNGPYCGFLLAMAGADVIKVEQPTGEHLRRRQAVGGAGLAFAMLNSNKRCVTLNLKVERGRELLKEMVRKADVLVENFAPGAMQRLGVGYEVLRDVNPRLVYAHGSGYGRSGPNRDYPAMDLTVQAIAGIMSVTGFADGPPVKAGPAFCDFLGGVHLYAALVTALFDRERTGLGRLVEVSMQEAVYTSMSSNIGLSYGSGGRAPPRTGNQHGGLAESPYNVYPTRDGYIAIICVGEHQWRALLKIMQRDDLLDDGRFGSLKDRVAHLAEVDKLVGEFTQRFDKDALFHLLIRNKIPCAPVRDLVDVINDQHMHSRRALEWVDHPVYGRVVLPNSPLRFDGMEPLTLVPSRGLGANNLEVFGNWLGLSEAAVEDMLANGVI